MVSEIRNDTIEVEGVILIVSSKKIKSQDGKVKSEWTD